MPKKQPHNFFDAGDGGRFMRVANSDVMTALTRASMLLCTAMCGLLLWYAQTIIEHIKEQDAKIEQAVLHQATTDGSVLMLQSMETENSRRIGKLEDMVIGGYERAHAK